MEISEAPYQSIAHCLPKPRGNVSLSNRQGLNASLDVAEHGCKWHGLPPHFGNGHTIYTRRMRWAKRGVLDRVFEALQRHQILPIQIEAVALDAPSPKCLRTGPAR
jgi:transposase